MSNQDTIQQSGLHIISGKVAGERVDSRIIEEQIQAAVEQGRRIAQAWRGARLLETRGLGHARILSADPVLSAAAAFIAGRSQVAQRAGEQQPSPMY